MMCTVSDLCSPVTFHGSCSADYRPLFCPYKEPLVCSSA